MPITEELLVEFLIEHEIETAEELDVFSNIIHLLMLPADEAVVVYH